MPKSKAKMRTTTISINDWGKEKNEDDRIVLLEHILSQIRQGYTSGHEDKIYWTIGIFEHIT